MAATAEELLTWVNNLFAAINEQRAFDRYNEHVQKLNVAAGDHCLYSDPVEAGRRRHITSICSLAECSGVSVVTLARGFMHNVFEAGRVLTPGEDETTCAEGLWILGPGEYMQACFEDVPEGCNLHMFLGGSGFRPPTLNFPLPTLIPTEEVEALSYLWVGDFGPDIIYKINSSTAAVSNSFGAPSIVLQGLTWDGAILYACDYFPDLINLLDPLDGTVLDSYAAPATHATGLAHDGTNLWCCDSDTDTIYKLDPTDGTVLDSFASPGGDPTGLAHDGTNLWCCADGTNTIYKLDPSDGAVLDSFAAPGTFPTGLAWDSNNNTLWCCDNTTGLIYKLDPSDGTVLTSLTSPSSSTWGLTWEA